jgi:hypothetical protein
VLREVLHVTWDKREPNPRDILIDEVRRGKLTPKKAEAEAEAKDFGPLAETADPEHFNPLRMPWWTLPMAVAWIAWRDAALVQTHCADYRKRCTHWVGRSSTIPKADGESTDRGLGARALEAHIIDTARIARSPRRNNQDFKSR